LFTENGSFKASNKSNFSTSSHSSKGYLVPVSIHFSFKHKKTYEYIKKDTIDNTSSSNRFTKFSDESFNFAIDDLFLKSAGITQKELDSIFEFSPDVKTSGKKLQIGYGLDKNTFLTTNSSSFQTKGYLNIKSSNWFFTLCQLIKTYIPLLIMIFIFYQLKAVFKLLGEKMAFSLQLSKKIKIVGSLIIISQILTFTLSIIFGFYYDYVGFENIINNNGIELNINPRLDFDLTLILVGLSLLIFSILLTKGNALEQENDLTI
jgi:hypothetical protein